MRMETGRVTPGAPGWTSEASVSCGNIYQLPDRVSAPFKPSPTTHTAFTIITPNSPPASQQVTEQVSEEILQRFPCSASPAIERARHVSEMEVLRPSYVHEPAARLPEPQADDEEPEVQAADDTDHTHSVASIVCNDHDRIKGLWRRYLDPTDSPQQRQLLVMQLLRELTVHMGAEEAVLYPAVAERVEEHLRDHALDEHESLKLFAADLEGMMMLGAAAAEAAAIDVAGKGGGAKEAGCGPGHPGFEEKLHQLMETFLEHTYEEEHRMLPALRDALEERELCELGTQFEAAKRHLPTRDAAAFEGTPPAIGTDSTQVLRPAEA